MTRNIVRARIKVFLVESESDSEVAEFDIKVEKAFLGSYLRMKIPDWEISKWIEKSATNLLLKRLKAPIEIEVLNEINILEEIKDKNNDKEATSPDDVVIVEEFSVDGNLDENDQTQEQAPDINSESTLVDEIEIRWQNKEESIRRKKRLRLIVRKAAFDEAMKHSQEDTSRETGGVILGTVVEDDQSVTTIFTGIVPALRAHRQVSNLNFTEEAWADIWRIIDQDQIYQDEAVWKIVGWYHTHPDFGVFLSAQDDFIHKECFTQREHVALVIDPVRHEWGYFSTDFSIAEEDARKKDNHGIPRLNAEREIEVVDDKAIKKMIKPRGFKFGWNMPSAIIHKPEGKSYE